MNTRLESLHMIERACWRELERAVHEREHGWRVQTLATVDADSGEAAARMVVIREVSEDARQLVFYCDARSPKVAQMRARPRGTMVAWSPTLGWQLRLGVRLDVEDSGLEVSSRWARVKLSPNQGDYLAALPPGTPIDHYVPERGTREYFAVVSARVEAIDWLELHALGHRRARFDAEGSRWLTP